METAVVRSFQVTCSRLLSDSMDINRADAKLIRTHERQKVLADFGLADAESLAEGRQCKHCHDAVICYDVGASL